MFYNDSSNVKKLGFLTKMGILRSNSKEITCDDEYVFFQVETGELIKKNKYIGYRETKKVYSIHNTETNFYGNIPKIFHTCIKFYVDHIESNEMIKMMRDLFIILIFLIVVFIIAFTGENKCRRLKAFLIQILKMRVRQKNQDALTIEILEAVSETKTVVPKDIQEELLEIKKLKKVKSNIDIIIDTVSENQQNVTARKPRAKRATRQTAKIIEAPEKK